MTVVGNVPNLNHLSADDQFTSPIFKMHLEFNLPPKNGQNLSKIGTEREKWKTAHEF